MNVQRTGNVDICKNECNAVADNVEKGNYPYVLGALEENKVAHREEHLDKNGSYGDGRHLFETSVKEVGDH